MGSDTYAMTFAANGKPRVHWQPMVAVVDSYSHCVKGEHYRTVKVWTEHKPSPEARFAVATGFRFSLN